MSELREPLELALEAMRKASQWIYYRRLAAGYPISDEEELLHRAVARAEEALRRPDLASGAQWRPCLTCSLDSSGRLVHSYGCPNATVFRSPPEPEKPATVLWNGWRTMVLKGSPPTWMECSIDEYKAAGPMNRKLVPRAGHGEVIA